MRRWLQTVLILTSCSLTTAQEDGAPTLCPNHCSCSLEGEKYIVDCSDRNFTTVPPLYGFEDLGEFKVYFYLNKNKCSYILRNSFYPVIGRLRFLEMTSNKHNIEVAVGAFDAFSDSLEVLKIGPVSGEFDQFYKSISKTSSLVELHIRSGLKHPQILTTPLDYPRLKSFTLHSSQLQDINFKVFDYVPLRALRLYDNKLNDIPKEVSRLMSATLEILSLSRNKITQIKDAQIPYGCKLMFLDISYNEVVYIEEGVLERCNNLKLLNLSHNSNLHEIGPNAFDGLRGIVIDLSFTRIRHIDFIDPEQVKMLRLTSTHIACNCELQVKVIPPFKDKLRGTCRLPKELKHFPVDWDLNLLKLNCTEYMKIQKRKRLTDEGFKSVIPEDFSQYFEMISKFVFKGKQKSKAELKQAHSASSASPGYPDSLSSSFASIPNSQVDEDGTSETVTPSLGTLPESQQTPGEMSSSALKRSKMNLMKSTPTAKRGTHRHKTSPVLSTTSTLHQHASQEYHPPHPEPSTVADSYNREEKGSKETSYQNTQLRKRKNKNSNGRNNYNEVNVENMQKHEHSSTEDSCPKERFEDFVQPITHVSSLPTVHQRVRTQLVQEGTVKPTNPATKKHERSNKKPLQKPPEKKSPKKTNLPQTKLPLLKQKVAAKRPVKKENEEVNRWYFNCPLSVLACLVHAFLTFAAFLTIEHGTKTKRLTLSCPLPSPAKETMIETQTHRETKGKVHKTPLASKAKQELFKLPILLSSETKCGQDADSKK
ncbi:uncharacterized protein LOC131946398 [Physella acuta]|uniref:uncharacterized protein LOC131946398 n=1 Tax=Physella acuta TaxID=109671 RepID=UPI0027DB65B4|nr:uncharacterized protein LOC131946398 [Physella acuta]